MEIYVGTLSMSGSTAQDYGNTDAVYRITYTDDSGESHNVEMRASTEIMPSASEDMENTEEKKAVLQWWGSILAIYAVIAILAASIIVAKSTPAMRMIY